jgi:hypothetical protein
MGKEKSVYVHNYDENLEIITNFSIVYHDISEEVFLVMDLPTPPNYVVGQEIYIMVDEVTDVYWEGYVEITKINHSVDIRKDLEKNKIYQKFDVDVYTNLEIRPEN